MNVFLLLFVVICLAILLLFRYFAHLHRYWQKRGIPCAKNARPIIGHVTPIIFNRDTGDLSVRIYKQHPGTSMVGFYNYKNPGLLVRDPELVKQILTTNFASFADNDIIIHENEEPSLSKNPFFSTGEHWRTGRTRLTAGLTATKLKIYSPMIQQISSKLVSYIDEHINQNGIFEVEARSLLTRVTAEVASTVGFGIDGHCFNDSMGNETFLALGLLFFSTDLITTIKMFFLRQFPWLLGLVKVTYVPKVFHDHFLQLVRLSIDRRKSGQKKNQHFIDSIIDHEEKEGELETKVQEISSHMMAFFLDTFETTAMVMTFLSYHLCVHKNIQIKVRDEVRRVLDRHKVLSYEAAAEMVYLEQAILESLRLFPVLDGAIKCCTKETELKGFDGLRCVVEPGTRVFIPVGGLHRDSEFWDDPDDFVPERFDDDKVRGRHKFVYLPFGEGPRLCPGNKIGRLVIKMAIAAVLMKFELSLSDKTKVPLVLDRFNFLPSAIGGMWIRITRLPEH